MDSNIKIINKIIKASKGQRDAMYFAARHMNLVNDSLTIPIVVTSAVLGSTLLSMQSTKAFWLNWLCSGIAFLNALMMTIQKIVRPGEYGETYQSYGKKWELFALDVLSTKRWRTIDDNNDKSQLYTVLIEKYNTMVDQSPLLPRWALSKFKECNEDLSSDDESDEINEIHLPAITSIYERDSPQSHKLTSEQHNITIEEEEEPIKHSQRTSKVVVPFKIFNKFKEHSKDKDHNMNTSCMACVSNIYSITHNNTIYDHSSKDKEYDILRDEVNSIKLNTVDPRDIEHEPNEDVVMNDKLSKI